jgi:hypothetical protein
LGGEKLNLSVWHPHNIFRIAAAIFRIAFIAGFFVFIPLLSAQEQEAPAPSAAELRVAELRAAEQSLTFDEAGPGTPAAASQEPASPKVNACSAACSSAARNSAAVGGGNSCANKGGIDTKKTAINAIRKITKTAAIVRKIL